MFPFTTGCECSMHRDVILGQQQHLRKSVEDRNTHSIPELGSGYTSASVESLQINQRAAAALLQGLQACWRD